MAYFRCTGGTDTSSDTVTSATLLSGYTAHDKNGNAITGTIPSKGATTHKADLTTKTIITAGTYCSGNQTIAPISGTNFAPENIKSGVTISVTSGGDTIYSVTGTGGMIGQLTTKTIDLRFENNLNEKTATFNFPTEMVGVTQIKIKEKHNITGWYEVGVGEATETAINGQNVTLRCAVTTEGWGDGAYAIVSVTAVGY